MDEQRVYVSLTNRKATLREPYPYEDFKEILKYRPDGWNYTPAATNRGWDGYLCNLKYHIMGAGTFLAMKEILERKASVRFIVRDTREPPQFDVTALVEARDYQNACVQAMIAASGTGGLVLNATGSGKTAITGMYLRALQGTGLFLVDELTLLKQARAELEKWIGEPVGEIGDSVFAPRRITVGTIQTVHLYRADPTYRAWSRCLQVMIIDEVHIALNRRNFQTVAVIKPPVVFGLTATLQLKRKNVAMPAYELCGPVVFEYPLERGVRERVLSKGIAVSVQVRNDVEEARYTGGGGWWQRRLWYRRRYPTAYRNLIVNGTKRNEVICELVTEAHQRGKFVILLLERVQHLKNMSSALSDIPHELVFGERRVFQRTASKRKFERGELRLLLANKVFAKGIDISRVDVIIDGAGMKSRNGTIQKYGRGVRLADNKLGLIYLDLADVGNRFQKAGMIRLNALKRLGIPVYRVDAGVGSEKILELAQGKLENICEGNMEKHAQRILPGLESRQNKKGSKPSKR